MRLRTETIPAKYTLDFFCKIQSKCRFGILQNNTIRSILRCCVYVLILGLLHAPSYSFDDSWLDERCQQEAAEYDAILSFKRIVTPEHVARVYSEQFSTKGASREAQAVWRLMSKENVSMEQALDKQFARYHAKRSIDEKEKIRNEVTQQIHDMMIIHDLVLAFEKAALTGEFVVNAVSKSWRNKNNWSAPHSIEHYLDMIKSKYDGFIGSGFSSEQAAIRAAVDTRNAKDLDRGVSPGSIYGNNYICYKGELKMYELWLRRAALGPLTEEESKDAAEVSHRLGQEMSRLTYYTHVKFGPRDYSLDRFNAWQIAADEVSENR